MNHHQLPPPAPFFEPQDAPGKSHEIHIITFSIQEYYQQFNTKKKTLVEINLDNLLIRQNCFD
jgi:hypothetical protein